MQFCQSQRKQESVLRTLTDTATSPQQDVIPKNFKHAQDTLNNVWDAKMVETCIHFVAVLLLWAPYNLPNVPSRQLFTDVEFV